MANDVELTLKAKNATQQAFAEVSKALKALEEASDATGKKNQQHGTGFLSVLGQMKSSIGGVVSSLGPVGTAVAGAFTVTAIVGAMRTVGAYAGQIQDTSIRLGMTTTAVQKLTFAAEQNSTSIGAVASAMSFMSRNLVNGDAGAVGALGKLNLNLEELRGMKPDEAFVRIGKAVAQVPDPMERTAIAVELLGRGGTELLPMFNSLEEDMARAVIVSEDLIQKGDELGDAWDSLYSSGKALLVNVLAPIGPVMKDAADFMAELVQGSNDFDEAARRASEGVKNGTIPRGTDWREAVRQQQEAIANERQMAEMIEQAQSRLSGIKLAEPFKAATLSIEETRLVTSQLDEAIRKSAAETERYDKIRDQAFGMDAVNKTTDLIRAIDGVGGVAKMSADQQKAAAAMFAEAAAAAKRNGVAMTAEWEAVRVAIAAATFETSKHALLTQHTAEMHGALGEIISKQAAVAKVEGDRARAAMETNVKAGAAAHREASDLIDRRTLTSYEYQVRLIQREADEKKAALNAHGAFYAEAMTAIELETEEKMKAARAAHDAELLAMRQSEISWANSFRQILSNIPALMQAALTGGGGFKGFSDALSAQAGESITSNLFKAGGPLNGMANSATKGISSLLGNAAGDAFALALPGMGSMLGPLISKGIGALGSGIKKLLGGPSADELAGRSSVAEFERHLQGLLTTQQRLEAGNRSWAMTTIAVRDAYVATGRSASEGEAAVARLWASSKQGADASKAAIQEINAVLDEQAQKDVKLQAAIEKYGFTIEELGPKFQKQRLSQMAQQLKDDFDILIESGISVGNVTNRMADSINEYLRLAVRTGQEVPAHMRPIAEALAAEGKLIDENGEKITDVGKLNVSWSQTMTQGFQRVVDKLQEVVDRLAGVRDGVRAIPTRWETEHVITTTRRDSGGGSSSSGSGENGSGDGFDAGNAGGFDSSVDVPGSASGGLFSTPTFRVIAETNPEVVGSPAAIVDAFTQAMRQTGGAGITDVGIVTEMRASRRVNEQMIRLLESLPIDLARQVMAHAAMGRA